MSNTEFDPNGHNPTVYGSPAEMKAVESGLPFDDAYPDDGCWNCIRYDAGRGCCTKEWNNYDSIYYIPERDDRQLDNKCDDWDLDITARPGDYIDTSA